MPTKKTTPGKRRGPSSTANATPAIKSVWPNTDPPKTSGEHYRFVFDQRYPEAWLVPIHAALARHADDNGECFPSVALLAQECRRSQDTIRRGLRLLNRYGYLSEPEPRFNDRGRQTSSLRRLLCPSGTVAQGGTDTRDGSAARGGTGAGGGGASVPGGRGAPIVAEDQEGRHTEGQVPLLASPQTKPAARKKPKAPVRSLRSQNGDGAVAAPNKDRSQPSRGPVTGGGTHATPRTNASLSDDELRAALAQVPWKQMHEPVDRLDVSFDWLAAEGFDFTQAGQLLRASEWYEGDSPGELMTNLDLGAALQRELARA